MKFGEAFKEYLHREHEQECFLDKCSHVEYKRLKKVLKSCRRCKSLHDRGQSGEGRGDKEDHHSVSAICQCQSCPCKVFSYRVIIYIHFCFLCF